MIGERARFYLPALDGMRFFAFFLVLAAHFPPPQQGRLPVISALLDLGKANGWFGVELFFVLSGFLLTRLWILERRETGRVALRAYLIRRVLRIWPLYVFALILGFLVFPLTGWLPRDVAFGSAAYVDLVRKHLMALVLFVDNAATVLFGVPEQRTLSALWTLSSEEQFYLALPLILGVVAGLGRRGMTLAIAVTVYALALRGYFALNGAGWVVSYHLPMVSPDAFMAGIILGFAVDDPRLGRFAHPGWLLLAVLLLAAAAILDQPMNEIWRFTAVAAGFGLILAHVLARPEGRLSRFLALAPLRYLGRISYGLYVYHIIAVLVTDRLLAQTLSWPWPGPWSIWGAALVLTFALTVAMAATSYALLERPFLKLKARFETVQSRPA